MAELRRIGVRPYERLRLRRRRHGLRARGQAHVTGHASERRVRRRDRGRRVRRVRRRPAALPVPGARRPQLLPDVADAELQLQQLAVSDLAPSSPDCQLGPQLDVRLEPALPAQLPELEREGQLLQLGAEMKTTP